MRARLTSPDSVAVPSVAAPRVDVHRRRLRLDRRARRLAVAALLTGSCVVAVFPLLWTLSTSLKPAEDIATVPPRLWPEMLTLEHYRDVAIESEMPSYFLHSLVITAATIGLTLLLAAPAAYAAARVSFRGKTLLLFVLLSTVMIPGTVILVPLYVVASRLGLLDTYLVLILIYTAWRVPMVLWIMKSFFEGVPLELEEAARLDGCGRLQTLVRIALPLSGPGLAASAVLVLVYVWNEFIIALTLTSKLRTITVGLYYYISGYGVEWGRLTASVVLALVPILVAFFVFQRRFIQGLTAGALKG